MKIIKTKSPEFLDEIRVEPEIKIARADIDFDSKEGGELGSKTFFAIDRNREENIGNLEYDEVDGFLKIRFLAIQPQYQGQNLGIFFYEQFIDFAQENGFKGIMSDNTVQGGALSLWYKLSEKYDVSINPESEDQFNVFVKTYEDGKVYKEYINTISGSVFKIITDSESIDISDNN